MDTVTDTGVSGAPRPKTRPWTSSPTVTQPGSSTRVDSGHGKRPVVPPTHAPQASTAAAPLGVPAQSTTAPPPLLLLVLLLPLPAAPLEGCPPEDTPDVPALDGALLPLPGDEVPFAELAVVLVPLEGSALEACDAGADVAALLLVVVVCDVAPDVAAPDDDGAKLLLLLTPLDVVPEVNALLLWNAALLLWNAALLLWNAALLLDARKDVAALLPDTLVLLAAPLELEDVLLVDPSSPVRPVHAPENNTNAHTTPLRPRFMVLPPCKRVDGAEPEGTQCGMPAVVGHKGTTSPVPTPQVCRPEHAPALCVAHSTSSDTVAGRANTGPRRQPIQEQRQLRHQRAL